MKNTKNISQDSLRPAEIRTRCLSIRVVGPYRYTRLIDDFISSCGASTWFRVTASPYLALRSYSLDIPHSVILLWASEQPDKKPLPDSTLHSQGTKIHALAGFEPAIPATEWPQNHTSDNVTTWIGESIIVTSRNSESYLTDFVMSCVHLHIS